MRVLWVATKPPWPPVDGGRLLAALTLEALAAAGHEVTLVAPVDPAEAEPAAISASLERWCRAVLVPARPAGLAAAVLRSVLGPTPVTISRHSRPEVRGRVSQLLAEQAFEVVHAEQPQALSQCREARRRGIPLVLRAQNVESDLWQGASRTAGLVGPLLRREARRLAAWEGEAVRGAAATVALTADDRTRLAELSGTPLKVHHVPAPFPARLPSAETRLAGAPAVVVLGSGGWRPNEEGTRWFRERVWPAVRAALPDAVLHLFGTRARARDGIVAHPAPSDSRGAFAEGAVLAVPLHVASGVRMKILEAWARGVAVVATPAAARGLDATDGGELLLARDGPGFAAALRRLRDEPSLAASMAAAGRALLEARHAPRAVAARLAEVYASACSHHS